MPILGIVAAAGGFTKFGDFYQIASSTATGGAVANFTFSDIPQDYTHLQIRYITRTTSANAEDQFYINYNGVTTSSYRSHQLYGNGTSAVSADSGLITVGFPSRVAGGTSAANIFSVGVIDILDYTNTNKYKTFRNISGYDKNGSGEVFLSSGFLSSTTNAITSLVFRSNSNLAQYSSFALYGIKAS
jgi:hypothetical protein